MATTTEHVTREQQRYEQAHLALNRALEVYRQVIRRELREGRDDLMNMGADEWMPLDARWSLTVSVDGAGYNIEPTGRGATFNTDDVEELAAIAKASPDGSCSLRVDEGGMRLWVRAR